MQLHIFSAEQWILWANTNAMIAVECLAKPWGLPWGSQPGDVQ